jgi:hypothetical protein
MAAPLKSGKQSVNLASKGVPGSRIRRDPPPVVKALPVRDPEERDRRDVAIGILAFTFALFVIMLALAAWSGWTPRAYIVEV